MPAERVYPALVWRKSRASGESGGCVEVAFVEAFVLVRDSRDKAGAILEVPSEAWREFLGRMQARDPAIRK